MKPTPPKDPPQKKEHTPKQYSSFIEYNRDNQRIFYEQITTHNGQKYTVWKANLYTSTKPHPLPLSEYTTLTPIAPNPQNVGKTLHPIQDDLVNQGGVKLPSGIQEYDTPEQLLEHIQQHIHKWLDISPNMEFISAHYVLLTYVYDRFNTLCYLRALGDTGTGKSRFLDVIGGLCYKSIMATGAVTPAPIYRVQQKWKGTLILDEADFSQSDEKSEVITILNSGFQKNKPVIKVDKNDLDNIQAFDVYGPKILATRKSFTDKALESRCLTEIMQETDRTDIPVVLSKEFEDEQDSLRNQCLLFRLRFLSDYQEIPTIQEDHEVAEAVEPRIRQATMSIMQLLEFFPAAKKRFVQFLLDYSNKIIEERLTSLDGMVANKILDIYYSQGDIDLTTKEITDQIKAEEGYDKLSNQRVGMIIKTFGLETIQERREGRKGRFLVWDWPVLRRLQKRYRPAPLSRLSHLYVGSTHQKNNIDKAIQVQKTLEVHEESVPTTHSVPYEMGRLGRWDGFNKEKLLKILEYAHPNLYDVEQLLKEIGPQVAAWLEEAKQDGVVIEPRAGYVQFLK